MLIQKRVVTGKKEIETIFENAAISGVDIIECYWNKLRPSLPILAGFEIPQITSMSVGGDFSASMTTDVKWYEGNLKFFPDAQNRCWGYIYDTPKNREIIKRCFSTGWFTVVDKKLRDELFEEAKKEGLETEHVVRDVRIRKSVREIQAESKVEKLEKEAEKLRKQLRDLELKKVEAETIKKDYTVKKLEGVRIPDREKAQLNIEESKNANKLTDYAS